MSHTQEGQLAQAKSIWQRGAMRSLIATFLESAEVGYSPHTVRAYRRHLSGFVEHLERARGSAEIDPRGVCTDELRAYLRGIESPTSRAQAKAALGRLFRYGQLLGLVTRSPVNGVPKGPRGAQRVPRVARRGEPKAMLAAIEQRRAAVVKSQPQFLGARDYAALWFLTATGCRASELVGLEWRHVDLDARSARVTGKGARERLIFFTTEVAAALLALRGAYRKPRIRDRKPGVVFRERHPKPTDPVFLNRGRGRLTTRSLQRLVARWGSTAGLSWSVNPHSFRHGAATQMLEQGADLRFIGEFLGHACITSTQRYLHLDVRHLREQHAKLFGNKPSADDTASTA